MQGLLTYVFTYLCVGDFDRQGSVVVDYQVAVDKGVADPTNTIVGAIKNESSNGTFGEFVVDVDSISADGELFKLWRSSKLDDFVSSLICFYYTGNDL